MKIKKKKNTNYLNETRLTFNYAMIKNPSYLLLFKFHYLREIFELQKRCKSI